MLKMPIAFGSGLVGWLRVLTNNDYHGVQAPLTDGGSERKKLTTIIWFSPLNSKSKGWGNQLKLVQAPKNMRQNKWSYEKEERLRGLRVQISLSFVFEPLGESKLLEVRKLEDPGESVWRRNPALVKF